VSAQFGCPQRFEFWIPNMNNHLLVENRAGIVVIRSSRNNLSSREKILITRHLALEGFIPEHHRFSTGSEPGSFSGLIWTVEDSSLKRNSADQRKALGQILELTVCAGLAWLALMAFAFLRAPR
jgi:hypothetical protein